MKTCVETKTKPTPTTKMEPIINIHIKNVLKTNMATKMKTQQGTTLKIITKNQPKPQVHVKCSYCGENISTKGKKNKSVGQGANFPHVSNLVKK